jgi:phosphate transport system protein
MDSSSGKLQLVTEAPALEQSQLLSLTLLACQIAASAVTHAADAITSGDTRLYEMVSQSEEQLDKLDREIDERVASVVVGAPVEQAREALTCLKMMTDLERIGDLVSGFASRAQAVGPRLEMQDVSEMARIASVLEQMLLNVRRALSQREVDAALAVLRADSEIDRLRNLIFIRHVEQHEGVGRESLQVLFMAQALERAGDHTKNLAEEVCHLISGHTLRHVLRSHDQNMEQMFLRWLRSQQPNQP